MITTYDGYIYGSPQTVGLAGVITWASLPCVLVKHRILEASYEQRSNQINRVQVFGDGVFTEDWDWEEIDLVFDQLDQDHDLGLTTTAKAHARGEALLREADINARSGYILVPLNCGQELYDVVTITDQRTPLSSAKRRVLAIEHLFNPAKGVYALKIGLGDV